MREKEAFRTPVFSVMERTAVSPKDGLEKVFTVLKAPEWVNVLALTPDGLCVLVNQYRHGSRAFSLELPGGVREPGDSLERTAERELMEETGYSCQKIRELISFNPNPAVFENSITTFLGEGAEKTGAVSFDENEETEVKLVPLDALKELFLSGRIAHALMAAPIGFFLAERAASDLSKKLRA